jgi:PAS domain S-box-containing protein
VADADVDMMDPRPARDAEPAGLPRALELHLQMIAEHASGLIVLIEPSGRRLYSSPAYRELFDDPESLGTSDVFGPIRAEDRERVRTRFAESMRSGIEREYDFHVTARDGSVRRIRARGFPIRDDRGRVTAMLGIGSDITGQAHVPHPMLHRGALLDALFEQVPIGIAVTDSRSSRIVLSNRRLQRMLGYTEDELLELDCYRLTHPDDAPLVRLLRTQLISGAITDFTQEKRVVTRDGTIVWMHNLACLIRDDRGGPAYVLELLENVTGRKKADELLARTAARLREVSQRLVSLQEAERRELAGELHDGVGQTLSALSLKLGTLSQLVSAQQPDAAHLVRECEALLEHTGREIRALISELRPAALQDFGLAAALRGLAEVAQLRYGFEVAIEADEGLGRLPPEVEASLYRIAQEAIANVGKHAQALSTRVLLRVRPGRVVMYIEDDGRGFDPATAAETGKRSRWGLLMMRERAEAIGARLHIRSRRRGTQVLVSWRGATG